MKNQNTVKQFDTQDTHKEVFDHDAPTASAHIDFSNDSNLDFLASLPSHGDNSDDEEIFKNRKSAPSNKASAPNRTKSFSISKLWSGFRKSSGAEADQREEQSIDRAQDPMAKASRTIFKSKPSPALPPRRREAAFSQRTSSSAYMNSYAAEGTEWLANLWRGDQLSQFSIESRHILSHGLQCFAA